MGEVVSEDEKLFGLRGFPIFKGVGEGERYGDGCDVCAFTSGVVDGVAFSG